MKSKKRIVAGCQQRPAGDTLQPPAPGRPEGDVAAGQVGVAEIVWVVAPAGAGDKKVALGSLQAQQAQLLCAKAGYWLLCEHRAVERQHPLAGHQHQAGLLPAALIGLAQGR